MKAHLFAQTTLENSLQRALERSEFLLDYEPRVDFRTGRITGMEALIRRKHPELGLISPGSFQTSLKQPPG
jgi:EAL domain-containing protein (putative c-di-GMP-specific phosphodiesterase class I)